MSHSSKQRPVQSAESASTHPLRSRQLYTEGQKITSPSGRSYEVIRVAFEGDNSDVYQCRTEKGALVAVKRVGTDHALSSPAGLSTDHMIDRDAAALQRIARHENIVEFVEFWRDVESRGDRYLVTSWAGETIDKKRPTDDVGVRHAMRQVCAAVSHVHKNGSVHGDLKPENLAIDDSGVVRLLDFGGSRAIKSGSTVTIAIGTLPYMAPEALMGHPVPASDTFSLAGILLYLKCGLDPNDIRDARKGTYVVPASAGIFKSVIECGLSSGTDDRYPNADELLAAVENCAAVVSPAKSGGVFVDLGRFVKVACGFSVANVPLGEDVIGKTIPRYKVKDGKVSASPKNLARLICAKNFTEQYSDAPIEVRVDCTTVYLPDSPEARVGSTTVNTTERAVIVDACIAGLENEDLADFVVFASNNLASVISRLATLDDQIVGNLRTAEACYRVIMGCPASVYLEKQFDTLLWRITDQVQLVALISQGKIPRLTSAVHITSFEAASAAFNAFWPDSLDSDYQLKQQLLKSDDPRAACYLRLARETALGSRFYSNHEILQKIASVRNAEYGSFVFDGLIHSRFNPVLTKNLLGSGFISGYASDDERRIAFIRATASVADADFAKARVACIVALDSQDSLLEVFTLTYGKISANEKDSLIARLYESTRMRALRSVQLTEYDLNALTRGLTDPKNIMSLILDGPFMPDNYSREVLLGRLDPNDCEVVLSSGRLSEVSDQVFLANKIEGPESAKRILGSGQIINEPVRKILAAKLDR
ncbi:protein kinase [Candidatus Micrarchaeota archaeon]|nr:protein kinase [Candidatus Micrarchaeota archaeon]